MRNLPITRMAEEPFRHKRVGVHAVISPAANDVLETDRAATNDLTHECYGEADERGDERVWQHHGAGQQQQQRQERR